MNAARWEQIQALFHAVADLPDPAQRASLEAQCAEDPALMTEVLTLLGEDARGDSLLDRDAAHVAAEVLDEGIPTALLDQTFGPYRLKEALGQGGMGVVYLAEREDLGSVAAIKILRDAWLSPDRRERFASEQRTLAQLNHPAIARLYDADTLPDGTPWFVMEYVEGVPLTEFCELHASSIPERLRLFRAVCEAVEHAHRHLIVHRDLKPSNILVKPDGSVKLLDFGIAKQLDSLEGPVDRTRTGLRLMTPAYAAPEQILGDPVGIHTDIYTLGVVLYELLTGRLPFDLSNRTPGEAETAIIKQGRERPSAARVGRGGLAARPREPGRLLYRAPRDRSERRRRRGGSDPAHPALHAQPVPGWRRGSRPGGQPARRDAARPGGAGGAGPRRGARSAGRAARDAGKHLPEARKARAGGFAARGGSRPTALALRTRQCRSSPKPGGARPAARRPSPG